MASTDENVSQFVSVTGATPEQAQFFLESANGDLNAALSSFLDGGGADEETLTEGAVRIADRSNVRCLLFSVAVYMAIQLLNVVS